MTPMQSFRIPIRSLIWSGLPRNLGFGVLFIVVSIAFAQGNVTRSALPLLCFLPVSLLFTWFGRKKVWFSLSDEGIHGTGMFFSSFCVKWSSPVMFSEVAHFFQGKPHGVTMLELDADGIPTFHQIFLPHSITSSVEFQTALRRYAPANHGIFKALNIATQP